MIAAEHGLYEVCECLVERGANAIFKDQEGKLLNGCVWAGAPVGAESENMGGGVWAGAPVGAESENMGVCGRGAGRGRK